jgi:putative heme-binding domain-containing protein
VDDRWIAAAIVASSAGRELAVLHGLLDTAAGTDKKAPIHSPLLVLLSETLGRADATASADSLGSLLATLQAADFPTRATIASAYVRGRGTQFETGHDLVRTLVEESAHHLSSEGAIHEAAVAVLARTPWELGGVPLLELASKGDRAALRALVQWDQPAIPERLLANSAFKEGTAQIREEILAVCFGRPVFHPSVLDAMESGALQVASVTPQRRQLLLKSKDVSVRQRAERLLALPEGDRKAAFEKAKASLILTGRSANGRGIFTRSCAICHRLEREGFAVGPDLFDIRNQPKESILLHIVVPDAEIAPGFAASVVELDDGRIIAGVQASETGESITLKGPGGAEETILRSRLRSTTPMTTSLMPTGMEAAMTEQELADLLAYLKGEA